MLATETASRSPGQRAELTFKHNANHGRHGWLRLTPAYSVKLVNDILSRRTGHLCVLDPFSGTGTTALSAAMRGHRASAVDLNPFLVWLAHAKTAIYDADTLRMADRRARHVSDLASTGGSPSQPPPIYDVGRWWHRDNLEYLCLVKGAIDKLEPESGPVRDLLLVAFCRALITLSNAAFNHQSMSFKTGRASAQTRMFERRARYGSFEDAAAVILEGAAANPPRPASIHLGDARDLAKALSTKFDLLITSPPYPNRMSYIRELRPYMFWLGYLRHGRDAGELDWRSIGGTWGIATSRLTTWTRSLDTFFPSYLEAALARIRDSDTKSGAVLANYVAKYFADTWQHLNSMRRLAKPAAEVHYIVGNSKFYETLVPTELVYRDMLLRCGAREAEVRIIRKRNSKRELYEYDVVARM